KGISLRTTQWWLHKEGFKYTAHKKALYFDGHEREDVIAYRQSVFIPCWVAAYDVGLGVKEAQKKVREFSSKKYTSH
ncbi:hypothetical protein M422DRAFT_184091, partial [Sphaerobolus stellatus SS14]